MASGSVLGPYLWNIGFDHLLTIPITSGFTLNANADDSVLFVGSDTRMGLQKLVNRCLNIVSFWVHVIDFCTKQNLSASFDR